MLYRSMKQDGDGRPRVARAGWGLGVRIEGPDIDIPVFDGLVGPLSGGMSVGEDWSRFPPSFIPRGAEGGTCNNRRIFGLEREDIPAGLSLRSKAVEDLGLLFVEPGHRMPIEEYEDLLASTRDAWKLV